MELSQLGLERVLLNKDCFDAIGHFLELVEEILLHLLGLVTKGVKVSLELSDL